MGKWIGIYGVFHLRAGRVGVDFRCAEVLVPENVLQDADVDMTVAVHQRGGCVPQLVYGIAAPPSPIFVRYLLTMACTVFG